MTASFQFNSTDKYHYKLARKGAILSNELGPIVFDEGHLRSFSFLEGLNENDTKVEDADLMELSVFCRDLSIMARNGCLPSQYAYKLGLLKSLVYARTFATSDACPFRFGRHVIKQVCYVSAFDELYNHERRLPSCLFERQDATILVVYLQAPFHYILDPKLYTEPFFDVDRHLSFGDISSEYVAANSQLHKAQTKILYKRTDEHIQQIKLATVIPDRLKVALTRLTTDDLISFTSYDSPKDRCLNIKSHGRCGKRALLKSTGALYLFFEMLAKHLGLDVQPNCVFKLNVLGSAADDHPHFDLPFIDVDARECSLFTALLYFKPEKSFKLEFHTQEPLTIEGLDRPWTMILFSHNIAHETIRPPDTKQQFLRVEFIRRGVVFDPLWWRGRRIFSEACQLEIHERFHDYCKAFYSPPRNDRPENLYPNPDEKSLLTFPWYRNEDVLNGVGVVGPGSFVTNFYEFLTPLELKWTKSEDVIDHEETLSWLIQFIYKFALDVNYTPCGQPIKNRCEFSAALSSLVAFEWQEIFWVSNPPGESRNYLYYNSQQTLLSRPQYTLEHEGKYNGVIKFSETSDAANFSSVRFKYTMHRQTPKRTDDGEVFKRTELLLPNVHYRFYLPVENARKCFVHFDLSPMSGLKSLKQHGDKFVGTSDWNWIGIAAT